MLCTLDDVKTSPTMDALRAVAPDEYDEEYLTSLIKAFTATAQRVTGRSLLYGTYTEIYTVDNTNSSVQLTGFPVESITSVKEDYNGNFSGATTYSSSQYSLYDGGLSGILKLRDMHFVGGVGTVQVVYIGGYQTIPDDLRLAAIDQVAHQFRVAPTSYLSSSQQSNDQAQYRDGDLLPHVRSILRRYMITCF